MFRTKWILPLGSSNSICFSSITFYVDFNNEYDSKVKIWRLNLISKLCQFKVCVFTYCQWIVYSSKDGRESFIMYILSRVEVPLSVLATLYRYGIQYSSDNVRRKCVKSLNSLNSFLLCTALLMIIRKVCDRPHTYELVEISALYAVYGIRYTVAKYRKFVTFVSVVNKTV